jgi:hypothetical protein
MSTEPVFTVSVEKEDVVQAAPSVAITGLGNIVSTFAFAGSSTTNQKTVVIGNLSLTTPVPACIQIQPRQSENSDQGFPDQFAVQVIETGTDHIRVRIRRLDSTSGWGQNLRLDVLVFDQRNPI